MRNIFILLHAIFYSATYSQSNSSQNKDSMILKNKYEKYQQMLEKASIYENKTELETQKVTKFKTQAHLYFDSANVAANKSVVDTINPELYSAKYHFWFNKSSRYNIQADSTIKIAEAYKDTTNMINQEAEAFLKQLNNGNNLVSKSDTTGHIIFYVVQLGAGNHMQQEYFKKAGNVEVVIPSDGLKRYIIGKFSTKNAALDFRLKLINMGYKDAFVRTMDSLKF